MLLHKNSKTDLNEQDIIDVIVSREEGKTLAARYNISEQRVSNIRHGRRHRELWLKVREIDKIKFVKSGLDVL